MVFFSQQFDVYPVFHWNNIFNEVSSREFGKKMKRGDGNIGVSE